MEDLVREQLEESRRVKQLVADTMVPEIVAVANLMITSLRAGGLVAFCGNGGSAADSQHLAGELISRFRRERNAFRGLALTTDTSILTAIGNDYGFDRVFARQVQGLMREGDVLVSLSTSGNSADCLAAVDMAREMKVHNVAFTGASGGQLKDVVDLCLRVPSDDTPRIQESHITIGHIICDIIEIALTTPE